MWSSIWAAPDGVLVFDETGDIKKGCHTVGVARQYTGVTGQVENCQVSVHAAYVSCRGQALVDAELYLPKASRWSRPAAPRPGCRRSGPGA